ncbi:MAG: hypothetical protein HXY53_09345 [Nitrospirae bacterium]|nr:hypothetical protein [Nitrospirota bacterium]
MNFFLIRVFLISFIFFIFTSISSGFELKTKYALVTYDNETVLKKFNKEVKLGSLSYLLKNKHSLSIEDEVKNKIDVIVERVQTILEMFSKDLTFNMVFMASEKDVQNIFKNKYGKDVDYIAFYSPKDKTIYLSIRDIELGVLAHEIAHVVIDHYYGISTPSKIHEVLAQYVETHLKE